MDNICKICRNTDNTEEYKLQEMMFGTHHEFDYFKCTNCGCLQIKQFPENIEKYYPANYLSMPEFRKSGLKKYLLKKREQYLFRRRGVIGKILTQLFGYDSNLYWFSETDLKKDDYILEVGCGRGELLVKLSDAGFNNLLGIDPFIEKDIIFNNKYKIIKKDLAQIDENNFDYVMFHHSFEHLKNPVETFELLKKVVRKKGTVLIRIPLIDSYAWEFYKTNWVQLDPPRHYFLHTVKSIKFLADKFGFKIDKIVYDSIGMQFWGSEQYKKQIALMDPKSHLINPAGSIFTDKEISNFNKRAKELNKSKKGDAACFYLTNT
ncbi:MAG: class I SAM-dependent methyltransferase [Ignavibacteriaceae bacterium]|jgi:SAM-dependent methyltransferase